jgi:flagellar protein FlgJ
MAINTTGQGNGLTMDLRSLDRLKASTSKDGKSGIKEAAKQLESLFMQELVKSMRATTMDTGMLDNQATEMGTSMLDTQLSQKLSGLPGGLSELIEKQLSRQMGATDKSFENTAEAQQKAQALTTDGRRASHTEAFVRKHQDAAKAAEAATGIPASNILGQAALESGWGKHEIKMKDGSSSHNLFGIKANADWKGKVAEVTTTEYIGGVPRQVTAKFRAYDSYEEAFKDHARLLTKSPRYSQTVAQADTARGYAQGLQKAGYATDPAYADKLTKVINTTLRLQRSLT